LILRHLPPFTNSERTASHHTWAVHGRYGELCRGFIRGMALEDVLQTAKPSEDLRRPEEK